MPQSVEIQGLLNVKSPSKHKSRRFLPWKTWKKQWVVLRQAKSSSGGTYSLELVIGRSSQTIINISPDDVVLRTESRTQEFAFGLFPGNSCLRARCYLAGASETESQQWMLALRELLRPTTLQAEDGEFVVSFIDNAFSRSAQLGGVYGVLRVSTDQVTVVDPATGSPRVQWPWNTLSQFHVSAPLAKEDDGHICSILTTSKFPAGVGRIHLYCADALTLTTRLLTKGRPSSLITSPVPRISTPYRHNTFSFKFPDRGFKPIKTTPSSPLLFPYGTLRKLSTTPRSLNLGRRLSRSEGNLRTLGDQADRSGRTTPSSEKSSLSSEDSVARGRIAPSLITAGLGLMLSTPGCSECDSESMHEYQRVGDLDSEDESSALTFCAPNKYPPPRRESGVSVASGVYEEIDSISIHLDTSNLDPLVEDDEEPPPPLPPRRGIFKKCASEDMADSEYTCMLQIPRSPNMFLSRSAGNTPLPSPPSIPRSHTAPPICLPFPKSTEWQKNVEESHYLPMSPGRNFGKLMSQIEEPHYMVMASVNIT